MLGSFRTEVGVLSNIYIDRFPASGLNEIRTNSL